MRFSRVSTATRLLVAAAETRDGIPSIAKCAQLLTRAIIDLHAMIKGRQEDAFGSFRQTHASEIVQQLFTPDLLALQRDSGTIARTQRRPAVRVLCKEGEDAPSGGESRSSPSLCDRPSQYAAATHPY
jgi:hypothetical protein